MGWRLRSRILLRGESGIGVQARIYVVFWRALDGCLWRGIYVLVLDGRVPVRALLRLAARVLGQVVVVVVEEPVY
jgi:hypothetical protein